MNPVELQIPVDDGHVSALFLRPAGAKALYLSPMVPGRA